jgi:hypothetical protein
MNNTQFKVMMLAYLYTIYVGVLFCIGGWLTDQQAITVFGNGMIYGGIVLMCVQSLLSYQYNKIEKKNFIKSGEVNG